MAELSQQERLELERLRREVAQLSARRRGTGLARFGRWSASVVLLALAAVLAGGAVLANYVRDEVLDTDTFVATVAPLAAQPQVRAAVSARLADELVKRADVEGLATKLAEQLEAQGAPSQLSGLVGPLVSGVTSFLRTKIDELMATERFETAWRNILRVAHEGVETVLTGRQGELLQSEGTTVNLDIGELLRLVKQQLVAEGLSIFQKVPDVSISYTLIQSDALPKIRSLTELLDTVATWLPWIALALLLAGVFLAPDRRRGLIVAVVFVGVMAGLLLAAVAVAKTYYVNNLPAALAAPDAAVVVFDTVLRFLNSALQTLLVAALLVLVAALLAGPSRIAHAIRRLSNTGIDALARLLARSARWLGATSRALAGVRQPVQVGLVIVAAAGLTLARQPGIATLLWVTVAVLLALFTLEVVVRVSTTAS